MRFEFTPAAERALLAAASWSSADSADHEDLDVPEVLLGLLAEPECRAALILARFGIDEAAIRLRFPHLASCAIDVEGRAGRFSPAWQECLHTAVSLLIDYPRPLVLATEHLLLGIAATPGEVSSWLAEHGLEAHALEAEVHRLSGHTTGALPWQNDQVDHEDALDLPDETRIELAPPDHLATLRIIDAAANRAGEGLRVVEDYLRFALDDRHLTAECKAIRHELTSALAIFSPADRRAARDTRADVGTDLTLASQQLRRDVAATVAANFERALQSLRSLEEFAKSLDIDVAGRLEQLRYRIYTLDRATQITRSSIERLTAARLYVLVDAGATSEALVQLAHSLVAAGVAVIQLRDKRLTDRELLMRARSLADVVRGSGTLFVMNDRPDLASLAGADGVHVGQDDLAIKDARQIMGPRALVGVSTHSIEQAREAVLNGANYIGVGPTFPSRTKEFHQFTGLELLRRVAAEIRLPAFAIGGILRDNLPQVLATGFSRVAVSSAVATAQDPAAAASELLAVLDPSRV